MLETGTPYLQGFCATYLDWHVHAGDWLYAPLTSIIASVFMCVSLVIMTVNMARNYRAACTWLAARVGLLLYSHACGAGGCGCMRVFLPTDDYQAVSLVSYRCIACTMRCVLYTPEYSSTDRPAVHEEARCSSATGVFLVCPASVVLVHAHCAEPVPSLRKVLPDTRPRALLGGTNSHRASRCVLQPCCAGDRSRCVCGPWVHGQLPHCPRLLPIVRVDAAPLRPDMPPHSLWWVGEAAPTQLPSARR